MMAPRGPTASTAAPRDLATVASGERSTPRIGEIEAGPESQPQHSQGQQPKLLGNGGRSGGGC